MAAAKQAGRTRVWPSARRTAHTRLRGIPRLPGYRDRTRTYRRSSHARDTPHPASAVISGAGRLAVILALVLSALLSVLALQDIDDQGFVGAGYQSKVTGSEHAVNFATARDEVAALARRSHTTIALTTPELRNPENGRSMLLFAGSSEGQRWLSDGYPDISPSRHTRVGDATATTDVPDPRGTYLVFGDEAVANELTDIVHGWGLDVITVRYFSAATLTEWVVGSQFLAIIGVTLALLALLGLSGAISGTRGYGIRRLRGASIGDLLRLDARRYLRFTGIAVLATAVAGVAALWLYNGLNRVGLIAVFTTLATALALITVALAHVVGVAVAVRTSIPDAVSGRVTGSWVLGVTYLLRVPALLLLVAVTVSFTSAMGQLASDRADADSLSWRRADDAARVAINDRAVTSGEGTHSDSDPVGHWLLSEAARDNTVLVEWVPSGIADAPVTDPEADAATPDGTVGTGGVLVVDRAYATDQQLFQDAGLAPDAVPTGGALLLLPKRLEADRSEILSTFFDRFDGVSGERAKASDLLGEIAAAEEPAGQSHFLYDANQGHGATSIGDVPVLILDDPATLYTEDAYAAAASRGGLLLRHLPGATERAAQAGAAPLLMGISPIATRAAVTRADGAGAARRTLLTLVFAAAVVIASGIGLGRTYAAKHAQRLFVGYLRGRSAWHSARAFVIGEAILAAAALGYSIATTVDALSGGPLDAFGSLRDQPWTALAGWQPVLVAGVLALTTLALALGCARSYRRVTDAQTSEVA